MSNQSDKEKSLNNKQDFKKLFNSFYPALYVFAFGFVKDRYLAEDIVQEVFIKLWEKAGEFKTTQKVRSFLYTSVKNKCLNHLEHKQVVLKHKEHSKVEPGIEHGTDHQIIEEETYRLIYNAINELPPECKKILKHSINGLSNNEIADKMNLSVNTIKTQKKIAYKFLRIQLKDMYTIITFLLAGTF